MKNKPQYVIKIDWCGSICYVTDHVQDSITVSLDVKEAMLVDETSYVVMFLDSVGTDYELVEVFSKDEEPQP